MSTSSQDLVSDDVMVLDAGDELYVWIGKDSDASEKENGQEMAKKYIDADPTSRCVSMSCCQ